jgi:hypothetical protein
MVEGGEWLDGRERRVKSGRGEESTGKIVQGGREEQRERGKSEQTGLEDDRGEERERKGRGVRCQI